MFVRKLDALVTKDYLDTRFREFETRIESTMDKRFAALEVRFERIDSRFSRIYLMFGITMVAVIIPVLQKLFG